MGKSDDKSLLNSFWNLFLIFPPPYLIVCASVCAWCAAELGQEVPLLQLVLFDVAIH